MILNKREEARQLQLLEQNKTKVKNIDVNIKTNKKLKTKGQESQLIKLMEDDGVVKKY